MTQCFPKDNNSYCFGAGLEQPASTAPRAGACSESQGEVGAFCTCRARLDLLSQNSNANRSALPADNLFHSRRPVLGTQGMVPGGEEGHACSSPRTPRMSHLPFAGSLCSSRALCTVGDGSLQHAYGK